MEGEEFELTINLYSEERVVNGRRPSCVETSKFKLVCVGYCRYFYEVKSHLTKYGWTPDEWWIQAFSAKFPQNDGNGSVGLARLLWVVDSSGSRIYCIPYVGSDGNASLWADGAAYDERWRWLVKVPESK